MIIRLGKPKITNKEWKNLHFISHYRLLQFLAIYFGVIKHEKTPK